MAWQVQGVWEWGHAQGALQGLQWHRAVCKDAACPGLALAFGGLAQLSGLHPGEGCRGDVGEWSICAVQTSWPDRRAAQLSLVIPGQLLQLSGALMPFLAPCQDPACARARGPLAADPPLPCSGKAVCSSPSPAPLPMPLRLPGAQGHGCCPSHAKPLRSHCAVAMYPSPRASRSQVRVRSVLCWGIELPQSRSAPGTLPMCPPCAGGTLCMA